MSQPQPRRRRGPSTGPLTGPAAAGRRPPPAAGSAGSDRVQDPDLADAVALLQAAADPVRLSVLRLLSTAPACVCDVHERIPIPASLLSYHLKVLREAGLVTAHRRGRWIDYSLSEDGCARLRATLPTNPTGTTPKAIRDDTGTTSACRLSGQG